MIIFVEINFFLRIQPFANWYFPIVWFGYIFLIDAVVYQIKGRSLIKNRPLTFIGMLLLSIAFWYTFEFFNYFIQNWSYNSIERSTGKLFAIISFSTVLPAFFESFELILSLRLFDRQSLKKSHKISKSFLISMISIGIIFFILPFIFPLYAFPLVWLAFFFILDPINYLNKQPSIIKHLKDRKLKIPLSLLLAGIALGVLWEFWNFWAVPKWTYNIPFLDFFKIFEMPVLGYLGYFPFAFELYSMYFFSRSLFIKKDKLLVE